jgi:transposase
MDEKKNRRRYTREFKLEVLKLVKERDGQVTEVVNNLGIYPIMLHRWVREYSNDLEYAFLSLGILKEPD